jgi:ubiquinone/menaquinone biosynthesis C-methylase UbiE
MKPAYLFLAVLVLLMYSIRLWSSTREGFESGESVTFEDPYDSVYASIYKALWHSKEKLEFEKVSMQDMMLADLPVSAVKVLDMCCGVAPHACFFKDLNVEYVGVDRSSAMLDQARKECPGTKFQTGDASQGTLFSPKSFSHVILLGFSIYEFSNPKTASDNAYMWLQPGGTFVVHIVNPEKFDPILDLSSPFAGFSLQKYSLERQTKSEIFFDEFKFTGDFKKKGTDATYSETLTYYDTTHSPDHVKYREQAHNWKMPSLEDMIEIIKTSGFRHKESVHLVSCGKEYQYLVYFTK